MKKNGFSLIEILTCIIIAGLTTTFFMKEKMKDKEHQNKIELTNEINELLDGLSNRIEIDGFKFSNWDQTSWIDLNELTTKQLVAKNANCSTGNWSPLNGNMKLKLVNCNLFKKNHYKLKTNANLKSDTNGFIESFTVDYYFENNKDFISNFEDVNNAFKIAKATTKQKKAGVVFFQYINKSTMNEVKLNNCINLKENCIFRTTLERNNGSDYVRVNGETPLINTSLKFIPSKGSSPLKCLKWSKNLLGEWTKSLEENCGIGIYKNSPIAVDLNVKDGYFETIFLNKKCSVYKAVNGSVLYSGEQPCGIDKTGNEIIQVVDNVISNKGYFKKITTKELIIESGEIKEIKNIENVITNLLITNELSATKLSNNTTIEINALLDIKESLEILNKNGVEKENMEILNLNLDILNIKNKLSTNIVTIYKDLILKGINIDGFNNSLNVLGLIKTKDSYSKTKKKAPVGNFNNINIEINKIDLNIRAIENKVAELDRI